MSTGTVPALPSHRKSVASVALFDLPDNSEALLAECFRQFGIDTIRLAREDAPRLQREKFEACVLPLDSSAGEIIALARGSNSGVYLHGLYEIQIFDSQGYTGPLTVGDCGGVYQQEDGSGGAPPIVNACRAPGEWQSFHIWFQAPKFDATGKKIANAKVLRVMLNDTHVQENIELPGPTVSHMKIPEAATNPIMLQGDHGPVAFRNIYIRDRE